MYVCTYYGVCRYRALPDTMWQVLISHSITVGRGECELHLGRCGDAVNRVCFIFHVQMCKVESMDGRIPDHSRSFICHSLFPNWNVTSVSPLAAAQLKKCHSNHTGKARSSDGARGSALVPRSRARDVTTPRPDLVTLASSSRKRERERKKSY